MLFNIHLRNRHNGEVSIKKIDTFNEAMARRIALHNQRRCDFTIAKVECFNFPKNLSGRSLNRGAK